MLKNVSFPKENINKNLYFHDVTAEQARKILAKSNEGNFLFCNGDNRGWFLCLYKIKEEIKTLIMYCNNENIISNKIEENFRVEVTSLSDFIAKIQSYENKKKNKFSPVPIFAKSIYETKVSPFLPNEIFDEICNNLDSKTLGVTMQLSKGCHARLFGKVSSLRNSQIESKDSVLKESDSRSMKLKMM